MCEIALNQTFSGTNTSVAFLTSILANGSLILGNELAPQGYSTQAMNDDVATNIAKAVFAFAIPTIWPLAKASPFVLDSGYNCGDAAALATVSPDVKNLTGGCYNGKQYYLVWPHGSKSSNFSAPPGLTWLDGTNYGGVTVSDLINGSLHTYEANGNLNGGAITDPTDPTSLSNLIDLGIATPGFIRIPVCSGDIAYAAWSSGVSINQTISPNYPCFVKPPNSSASTLTSDNLFFLFLLGSLVYLAAY